MKGNEWYFLWLNDWMRSNEIERDWTIFTVHKQDPMIFTLHEWEQPIMQYDIFKISWEMTWEMTKKWLKWLGKYCLWPLMTDIAHSGLSFKNCWQDFLKPSHLANLNYHPYFEWQSHSCLRHGSI